MQSFFKLKPREKIIEIEREREKKSEKQSKKKRRELIVQIISLIINSP
jgi:hypothetical protein